MSTAPTASPALRRLTWVVAVLATAFVAVQALVVRPTSFPGGAGLLLGTGPLAGALAAPETLRTSRPPNLSQPEPVVVTRVAEGGPAWSAGVRQGDLVLRLRDGRGRVVDATATGSGALAAWRDAWWLDTRSAFTLTVDRGGRAVDVEIAPRWFPNIAPTNRGEWLVRHLGSVLQIVLMTGGALALVGLRVRGRVAALMTLTMFVNTAIAGPLVGGEAWLPPGLREAVSVFGWLVLPVGFVVVGWMIVNFPSPSPLIAQWPWLFWVLVALAVPILVPSVLGVAYLWGVDAAHSGLSWWAARPGLWSAGFVAAEVVNVAIIVEGLGRYLRNPDVNERRRIQLVVATGVPAAFAWSISQGAPIVMALVTGEARPLPWLLATVLHVVMLLPAIGLPYAVAVKHVFSPRTVLRRSLQYALARRTLTVLAVLPAVPLVVSLVRQRDLSLAAIVTGQPVFYAVGIGLLVLARRYRERAMHWLDRRFFRTEYDAREILMSLAGRMPFETDPADLVALVIQHVDSALHPEAVAVLVEVTPGRFETVGARPRDLPAWPVGTGLTTLLRWSRAPLEIFLDDERSTAARLPPDDRAWLARSGLTLLAPILSGSPDTPELIGCLALGAKQSEEPYTREDRELLSAIAAQMAVSLDLSRLRRRAETLAQGAAAGATTQAAATLGRCPSCERCVDLAQNRCPDDGTPLVPVPGIPAVVDGKYRVDAVVGRGGMGAVFRARDVRLDRDVALKVVRAELVGSPEARLRFRREAQIVAQLQHPAVVAVFDYGTMDDGAAYIIMEFVRGEDLRQRLRRQGALPLADVVVLVSAVASGVQAAHDNGVLHRDLKPENVLLPESGAGPKVLDFGVAKQTRGRGEDETGTATQGGTVVGTPAYMSPEQLRGQPLDGRTDVFSLGVMTFEMLTGRLPFGAGSFVDVGLAHERGAADPNVDLAPDVRAVLGSALAVHADDRPASPTAFAAALQRASGPS